MILGMIVHYHWFRDFAQKDNLISEKKTRDFLCAAVSWHPWLRFAPSRLNSLRFSLGKKMRS